MRNSGTRTNRLVVFVVLLALMALACNAPILDSTEETTSPTDTPTPESASGLDSSEQESPEQETPAVEQTPAPAQTLKSVVTSAAEDEDTATPLPTFTPISQPTLAPTQIPTHTPTRRPAPTSVPATPVPVTPADTGPLSFSYSVSWRLKPGDPGRAIATVAVEATGGGGGYVYWVDQERFDNPVFELERAACRPMVHTLTVVSADGQSRSTEEDSILPFYYEAPCPTPTPHIN